MKLIKNFFNKKQQTKVFDIKLESLKNAFLQMENEAQWDTSKRLYWGYYFLDQDLKKIESFAKKLEASGFTTVEMRIVDNNMYLLHTEEHVIHSPQTLFDQCHKLAKLAQGSSIEVFDGWDVEAVTLDKGLVE